MKSGVRPVVSIALQIARNSYGCPMQSLKPVGLPPDMLQLMDELDKLDWRRERRVARRRNAILPERHATNSRDLRVHLGRRQDTAMAGLGALAQLVDHFHLIERSRLLEPLRRKLSVLRAASEVAGADLPNDVAAAGLVIGA